MSGNLRNDRFRAVSEGSLLAIPAAVLDIILPLPLPPPLPLPLPSPYRIGQSKQIRLCATLDAAALSSNPFRVVFM
jgi:hypothetical protein